MLHRRPSDLRMTLGLNLWDYPALFYLSKREVDVLHQFLLHLFERVSGIPELHG